MLIFIAEKISLRNFLVIFLGRIEGEKILLSGKFLSKRCDEYQQYYTNDRDKTKKPMRFVRRNFRRIQTKNISLLFLPMYLGLNRQNPHTKFFSVCLLNTKLYYDLTVWIIKLILYAHISYIMSCFILRQGNVLQIWQHIEHMRLISTYMIFWANVSSDFTRSLPISYFFVNFFYRFLFLFLLSWKFANKNGINVKKFCKICLLVVISNTNTFTARCSLAVKRLSS